MNRARERAIFCVFRRKIVIDDGWKVWLFMAVLATGSGLRRKSFDRRCYAG